MPILATRDWPVFITSKFTNYPFQHLRAQFGPFFGLEQLTSITTTIITFFASFIIPIIVPNSIRGEHIIVPGIWFVGLSIHAFVQVWRAVLLDAAFRCRARYFWALSFWDVSSARDTLSRLP